MESDSAETGESGFLSVWYLDGRASDEKHGIAATAARSSTRLAVVPALP
jgi:hypothetical protein